ncbi:Alpha/Beta hydrolase protein [Aspergillus tetrazonus]
MEPSSILRPPFDPALEKARKAFPDETVKSVQSLRSQPDSFTLESFLNQYPNLTHAEHTIPGPPSSPNGPITLSIFQRKPTTRSSTELRPAIYNIHGGGQIAGTRFSGISFLAPLAPEHRAPAALEDCYAGLSWVFASADKLGIDGERILIVGVSGGAPIAAGCAMRAARDHLESRNGSGSDSKGNGNGKGEYPPRLCGQLLSTPMLDDRVDTVSSKQYMSDGGPWNAETNRMAWDCVLGPEHRGTDSVSALVAPARATATDIAGIALALPPAFIDVGAAEVFRDEAVAYASVLWETGVSAELHVWPGAWHGFDAMAPDAAVR